jgi:hypothetical protein
MGSIYRTPYTEPKLSSSFLGRNMNYTDSPLDAQGGIFMRVAINEGTISCIFLRFRNRRVDNLNND